MLGEDSIESITEYWREEGFNEEQVEDELVEALSEIPHWHNERQLHDGDGFFAELGGSEKCLALGHTYDDELSGSLGNDWYLPRGEHAIGWDGEVICLTTKYGVACMDCEGECCMSNGKLPINIWELASAERKP